jgi:8-oxo-dGTP pyrophosphatase MutT (NUDIX family)
LRSRFANPAGFEPERHGDSIRGDIAEPTAAAVLVPIVLRDSPTVLLTQRTAHLSDHSGQVAFPGGRRDAQDTSLEVTALREAHEEIGLESGHVQVLGRLTDYFTGSGYQITPVIALVQPGFRLQLQADEVDAVFEVPLAFLMDPDNHQRRTMQWEGRTRDFYAMPYTATQWLSPTTQEPQIEPREFFIWGATAAMLRNFYRFLYT